ncbi:trigger factor [Eupeodes corollae]|uniref:trigger factor n=1 Tax=Eupeodes corollae TaxID=290404 RepID=UPI00248F8719|nr:trigger factor [Eupeodes corollae]
MNSPFGEVFLFLTDLAWKSRVTIPVLVTTVFLIMDIRLQIEINIQSGQPAVEFPDLDDDSLEEYPTESDDDIDDDEDEDDDDDIEESDVLEDLGRLTH